MPIPLIPLLVPIGSAIVGAIATYFLTPKTPESALAGAVAWLPFIVAAIIFLLGAIIVIKIIR